MKKVFLFAALFCCIQLLAQDKSTDFIDASQDVSATAAFPDSVYVKKPSSLLFLELLLQAVESDYDTILDRIAPDVVIARRGNDYFQVNIVTGEECMLAHYDEDEASSEKSNHREDNSDLYESDYDDE